MQVLNYWGERGCGFGIHPIIAISDSQIDSIQCLNFAQNLFNSIFNSKLYHENSIQKFIQFKIVSWKINSKYYSIQINQYDSIQ